jgi:hypothetical protein
MSSPEEIASVSARLLERLEAVEQRLLRIESAMGLLAPAPEPEPVREALPPPLPVSSAPPTFYRGCRRAGARKSIWVGVDEPGGGGHADFWCGVFV